MRWLRIVPALGVAPLGERAFTHRGRARCHGDVRTANFGKEAIDKLRAGLGVSERGCDPDDLQFRAAQSQSKSKSVINVVADVGVNDHFFGDGKDCGSLAGAEGRRNYGKRSQDTSEDSCRFGHAAGMLAREMKTSWAGFPQSEALAHRKNRRRALRLATLAHGKISPAAKFWCGREDSNLHGIATASPSS